MRKLLPHKEKTYQRHLALVNDRRYRPLRFPTKTNFTSVNLLAVHEKTLADADANACS